MTERVDILLASYQGANYIEDQVNSILAQTYPHFRLWIRDDGSSDQTLVLLNKIRQAHPDKVFLIPSQENVGITQNFSLLMNYAKSSYLLFADQDDFWLPHKIEVSLQEMRALEQRHGKHTPLVVHSDLKVVKKDLTEIASSFWRYTHLNPRHLSLNRLLVQNVLTGCTMLMNRSLADLAHPIPPTAIMHDWWIALVAACFGHIGCIDQTTLLYRQHGLNDTGAKRYGLGRFFTQSKPETQKKATCASQTYSQARLLLERYEEQLSRPKKTILQAYVEMEHLSYLKQKKQIIRYRFFKQGFLRNLKLLLAH